MSNKSDRDQLTERLLRRSFQRGDALAAPVQTPACVDAETLAAWADEALTGHAAREVETHLSNCAHCQAMLATFAATESAAQVAPAAVPFWHRWSMRWVVPMTAGATAVLLWTFLPPDAPVDQASQTMARVEQAAQPQGQMAAPEVAPAPAAAADERAANAFRESASARQGNEQSAAKMTAPMSADAAGSAPAAMPPPPSSSLMQAAETRSLAKAEPAAPFGPPLPAASPVAAPIDARRDTPPPAAGPVALPRDVSTRVRAEPPAPGAAGNQMMDSVSAVAAPPMAQSRSGERSFTTADARILVEFAVAPPQVAAQSRSVVGGIAPPPVPASPSVGAGRGGAAPAAPPPPAPAAAAERVEGGASQPAARAVATVVPVRWRIMTDGRVERLAAGSTTWDPVVINPPAAVTNGAAPSALVCWLVGRGGVVLRSTDGRTFVRLPFPTVVDLASVVATNALEARVTTVDGRVFATTDGGVSWR